MLANFPQWLQHADCTNYDLASGEFGCLVLLSNVDEGLLG